MAKHKPMFVIVCLTEGLPNLDFSPIHASSKSKHIRALNSPGPEGLLTKWIEESDNSVNAPKPLHRATRASHTASGKAYLYRKTLDFRKTK